MSADHLTRLRAHAPGAWEELYDSLAGDLRAYIKRIGGKNPDDILGDTMVSLVKGLPSFEGTSDQIRPWAFTIAYHRVIDASRRQSSRPSEIATDFSHEDAHPYTPLHEAPDLERLSDILDTLTPDQRSAIWLRYVSDLSIDETASVMGKTPEAVSALTHRAIRQLRKSL